ncbi:exodeoxyribonuclease V subunit gamma [Reinekea marinisedimentorum]|uniref:RecBCD enzyme subunit RecC n=1 Tax=Reinekea marinisedimentorum TaxID=230495 RepID=A0A4R3I7C2_9GAMM|nr:exodeoxyribonuclease V subunit gamma [Reinekea marinisedimentorum]TCS41119.1 DNA helicase/exodeoxyribonuclease V gamma subunit [Reinekea marinisedimentorum]
MFYSYPSNRMENLVFAFNEISKASSSGPFSAENILVQHPGMQHWLSMAIANLPERQVCMNINYPLPVRYFWDLIRHVIGSEQVPERSAYSREILAWRIFNLLGCSEVTEQPLMAEPTLYWQQQPSYLQHSRRFQLAEQLADLYEQYLMFRPDWIDAWEASELAGSEALQQQEGWQAELWRLLTQQDDKHPLRLIRMAMDKLSCPAEPLPDTFYLFGINTMAPVWLNFLQQLSEQCDVDVHLFYLNPSAEYWDDIKSEKQAMRLEAKKIQQRASSFSDENDLELHTETGNPLLASLGQQGQAFVRLLSETAHFDTPVFSANEQQSALALLQHDVLTLNDARSEHSERTLDDSISIAKAHSAFREVQALHDWLLHQFNNDASLTPKDVVVMCPNIENYAPFIHAVFSQSFADIEATSPPLPCSVADRNLKDADPTVAAFLELLNLPDARFEVNQILSWLRVPAIGHKFELADSDLVLIEQWLASAHIHWGLNARHKTQWVNGPVTEHFTWRQGLKRLLLGFAYSDEESLLGDQLLLPDVEGANALLLGKLINILEQLEDARSTLNKARTPSGWQKYLTENIKLALISGESEFERSNQHILNAINDFTEFANRGGMADEPIPLAVIRTVLENAFASPEQTGSQFMTGQITVCSLVPMRSIPFKVVALLGLNDGEFPRTRPPLGFDLMAHDTPRLGDRSRRGDDRYLFLEAILSARQALYLSYQGFDVRNNEQRPPSLVLEELFDYLKGSFNFSAQRDVKTIPLQPFSLKNYAPEQPSFNRQWLKLLNAEAAQAEQTSLPALSDVKTDWQLHEWVQFFTHPAKYFAQQRLGLFLQQSDAVELDDAEPFALSHLDRYRLQENEINLALNQKCSPDLALKMKAGSELPVFSFVDEQLDDWQQQAQAFSKQVAAHGGNRLEIRSQTLEFNRFKLSTSLPECDNGLLFWRMANPKGSDLATLWLHHLFANVSQPTTTIGLYRGKDNSIDQLTAQPVKEAGKKLEQFYQTLIAGLNQPLIVHSQIALSLLNEKETLKDWSLLWLGDSYNFKQGLLDDPYNRHFFAVEQDYEAIFAQVRALYSELPEAITLSAISEDA